MAKKYQLIGYDYDRFNRGNKFQNQVVIDILDDKLNNIQDIDRLTASMSRLDFSRAVKEVYGSKSGFSIRTNDNNGASYYYRTIFDNPDIVETIDSLEERNVKISLGPRTYSLISVRSAFFIEQFSVIEKALENRDVRYLNTIFSPKSDMGFLLHRFVNSPYDEVYNSGAFEEIELVFRNYENFRKFVVGYDKEKHQRYNNDMDELEKAPIIENKSKKETKPKIKIPLIEEDIEIEETYSDAFDYEKEEFMDEKELFEMSGFDNGAKPEYYTGRKL